jgi:hypothetical protein
MFQMPSWQAGAPDDPGRMVTDIAANANPNTGYAIAAGVRRRCRGRGRIGARRAYSRDSSPIIDVGDLREMAFQGRGDARCHDLRGRARRLDDDHRQIDLRQHRHRHQNNATIPASAAPNVSTIVVTGREATIESANAWLFIASVKLLSRRIART